MRACDICGTDKSVRAPWVSIWNGNELDLCTICAGPLSALLDDLDERRARRRGAGPRQPEPRPSEPPLRGPEAR